MPRGDLRLADLEGQRPVPSKLMNVKVPAEVSDAIDRIVEELDVLKTDVVIALLNEGLDAFGEKDPRFKQANRREATAEPPPGVTEK